MKSSNYNRYYILKAPTTGNKLIINNMHGNNISKRLINTLINRKSISFVFSIIFVFCSSILHSQTQTPSGKNHNEQVTIVSSFDPSINQAYKINTSPANLEFNIEKPDFSFQSLNINQPTKITLKPIVPVVINADKRVKITNNSLVLGVGSLLSPYLNYYHSNGQKNNYRFDAHLYHLSTFKNIKDYSPSPQSKTTIDLGINKFLGHHIINAGIVYSLRTNRYYGFKPDDFPTYVNNDDKLKQMFNLAKANIGLSSNYRNNKKLSHKINLDAYYFFDKYGTTELNTNLNVDVHKNFDVTDMLDYQELGIEGKFSYYNNADSINTSNDILISLTPYFNGNYGIINFHLGLNFNLLTTTNTNIYFYPILDVNVSLIPDVLTVFGGLDGDVSKQSFKMLAELNPWVSSTISTQWDHTFKAYGGFRGNIAEKVNYSTQVTWEKFNNMYFFYNVPDDTTINYLIAVPPLNKFDVLHDKGSVFGISMDLTYAATNKINIILGAKYKSYSLDSLSSPYQKPTTEVKLGASFMITEKVRAWTNIYYYGKRTTLDISTLPNFDVDMDAFIDLNLGADYQLNKQLSVFLSLTNILNNKYQRYYNYPVNGIQIMGGIKYVF